MIDVPDGQLYLGEGLAAKDRERDGEPVLLEADDLTTHGVIVGMTGSGKTGLGVDLIEEALLQGIPTIVVDPKGDLGNLLLTFPELRAEDFAPWVEEGDPAEVAEQWRDGLADWKIEPARIAALRDAAEFTIYTPGSMSGVPLNVVGSLRRPPEGSDVETVSTEVEGFVSGLLNMVGIDADPLSSREHILLSNLIENAWAAGADLSLADLVAQVQNPPLKKLGVYELEAFYPAKDRTKLAMTLNGLLASRAFAAWAEGPELDVDALLKSQDGSKPACAIVSISHLSDEERQFVVSLVLGRLVTWMRRQAGTSKLRVLVYFDEVMGFVPPSAVPPAKKPILTLFKTARAFGVGIVLATQNPVDVDYKGLSNAGTWMIGRLQTEQDKARLLDGLSSAGGSVDVKAAAETISSLGKREFMIRTAGSSDPSLFTTRWAMSYLRGPLTRDQIATLMKGRYTPTESPASGAGTTTSEPTPAGADSPATTPPADAEPAAAPTPAAAAAHSDDTSPVAPQVAEDVPTRWMSPGAVWAAAVGADPAGKRLAPALLVHASLLFDDRKLGIRVGEEWKAAFTPLGASFDASAPIEVDYADPDLTTNVPSGVGYVLDDAPLDKKAYFTNAQKAIADQLYRTHTHQVLRNSDLELVAEAGETPEAFAARCKAAATEAAQADIAKLQDKFANRISKAEDALATANDRAAQAEAAEETRKASAVASKTQAVLGMVLGRRRVGDIGTILGSQGRSNEAAQRVQNAYNQVQRKTEALQALHDDLAKQTLEIDQAWQAKAAAVDTVDVHLRKSDIRINTTTLVWIPVA